jgi:bifunctional DNA-binding transcriptional regulator/antitoxin component of YhaV-PrlF toxin-antitoxin module
MKLQKRFSRKVGKREYAKWIITIPPKEIELLGWKEGEELEADKTDDKLIVQKRKKKEAKV